MTRRDGAAHGALSIEYYPDLISQIIISSIHRQRGREKGCLLASVGAGRRLDLAIVPAPKAARGCVIASRTQFRVS